MGFGGRQISGVAALMSNRGGNFTIGGILAWLTIFYSTLG